MTRFLLVFVLAFSSALLVAYYVESLAAPIFKELLSAFIVLTLITGTISYALYSYVDGIIKDIATDDRVNNKEQFNVVITKLSELKKEILVNAFTVVMLLIIERVSHGVSLVFPITNDQPFNWVWAFSISVRVACFASSVAIAVVQFRGFIYANEFRTIISRAK
ncbi:MAG: hypothetical protein COB62_06035 [Piscirickettsiaceae bacterium]|nr:MAG: hypothetical protein COB62_06035 [Piscirickettsiaceae bacterium]